MLSTTEAQKKIAGAYKKKRVTVLWVHFCCYELEKNAFKRSNTSLKRSIWRYLLKNLETPQIFKTTQICSVFKKISNWAF